MQKMNYWLVKVQRITQTKQCTKLSSYEILLIVDAVGDAIQPIITIELIKYVFSDLWIFDSYLWFHSFHS